MINKRHFMESMIDQTVFHPEAIPGYPIVEIAGERRVLIENHNGIAAYGKNSILVNVKYGAICISGCNLEIVRMTKEQLIICGNIGSVELQRRKSF